jgi:hypothetical protein
MWEPRRLTTLWAFTVYYRDSLTFLTSHGRGTAGHVFRNLIYKYRKVLSCNGKMRERCFMEPENGETEVFCGLCVI